VWFDFHGANNRSFGMLKSKVGVLGSPQFLKNVRQELVDKLHELLPKRWKIGIEVKNRRGQGPSLFFVRKSSACVVVYLGSSGPEIGKVRLDPDRNDGLKRVENYNLMQALIEEMMLGNEEAAAILNQL
jgi:hypothetical protein